MSARIWTLPFTHSEPLGQDERAVRNELAEGDQRGPLWQTANQAENHAAGAGYFMAGLSEVREIINDDNRKRIVDAVESGDWSKFDPEMVAICNHAAELYDQRREAHKRVVQAEENHIQSLAMVDDASRLRANNPDSDEVLDLYNEAQLLNAQSESLVEEAAAQLFESDRAYKLGVTVGV